MNYLQSTMKALTIADYSIVEAYVNQSLTCLGIMANLRYCDELIACAEAGLQSDSTVDAIYEAVFELIGNRRMLEEGEV